MTVVPLKKSYVAPFVQPGALLNTVAVFDVVPPGSIWTGTISISISTQLNSSVNASQSAYLISPMNDLMSNIVWTLYRNGTAEWSWVGYTALCNLQAYGNDQLIVVGKIVGLSPISPVVNQINVTVNYIGYSGDAGEIPLTVPFLSTSTSTNLNQNQTAPQISPQTISLRDLTSTGTFQFLANNLLPAPYTGVQVWSASISLAISAITTVGTTAQITQRPATGTDLLALSCETEVGTSTTVGTTSTAALAQELHGAIVDLSTNPINLIINATAANVRCSATLCYSLY